MQRWPGHGKQDKTRPDQTGEKKEREKIGAIENMGEGRNKVRDDRKSKREQRTEKREERRVKREER